MALSATAIAAMLGRETDEVVLVLLTIDHASLDDPIRVVDNTKDITSNGNTFTAFPFEITLPSDGDAAPKAQLTIANVDRSIGDALDQITTAPTVKMQLILASDPDTIEREWDLFELVNVQIGAIQVTGDLAVRARTQDPWPNVMVTPGRFPALFAHLSS